MASRITFGLGLLFIAGIGRLSLQCVFNEGLGIDSLPESEILDVNMTENEVIGFSCDITQFANCSDATLSLCIKRKNESAAQSLEQFMDDISMWQYELSMLEIVNDTKTYVNLRVQTLDNIEGLQKKDKAFVALIPNESTVFCITVASNRCSSGPVVNGSARKYIFTTAPPMSTSRELYWLPFGCYYEYQTLTEFSYLPSTVLSQSGSSLFCCFN